MGPDLLPSRTAGTCPSCGASVRGGAAFCTLCFHDLRPAPETVPAAPAAVPTVTAPPAAGPATTTAPADPLTAPLWQLDPAAAPAVTRAATASPAAGAPADEPVVRTWPCTTCATDNPLDADVCRACGAGFLASLRDTDGPALVLPVVGDLGSMSRAGRAGVAVGLVLLVCLLVTMAGVLL